MKIISLNGNYKCRPDTDNIGLENEWYLQANYNFKDNKLYDIFIPASFNLIEGYEYFEGIFWHFHQFDVDDLINADKFDYHIRFKGSNYNTKVWLNENYLGDHNGGFLPFIFKEVLK